MVSWLVRSTPDQAVQVRALAWDIVLCSWAIHFTLCHGASLHPGVQLGPSKFNAGGNPAMD